MQLGPPTLAGLQYICSHLRARDRFELEATRFTADPHDVAASWYASWSEAFLGQMVSIDGEPVAVLALVWVSPSTMAAGLLATDRWDEIVAPFARHCLRRIKPMVLASGCRRVECRTWEGHKDARRLLTFFGARVECRLPGFGKGGAAFLQYAWVDPAVREVRDVQEAKGLGGHTSTVHH